MRASPPPIPPSRPPLLSCSAVKTWVRIRPIGDMGHVDGERVEKELGEFDEKSVNIVSHDQRGKVQAYNYPARVFPTTCTQEDVGNEILPELLQDFWSERNTIIFAYGQTGTGKTTTMFGFPESLSSEVEDPGWGLLPRAVHATLVRNAEQARHGVHSILLLSAVEFYAFMASPTKDQTRGQPAPPCPFAFDVGFESDPRCGQAFDLGDVAGKQMCTMKGHTVLGNTYTRCDSPAILKAFIERVYGNRKVVATRMNEGSSRSHCAIMLTLLTLDASSRRFRQTQFSIVDMAGAERPEKALGERISKEKAMQVGWRMRFLGTGIQPLHATLEHYESHYETILGSP